MPAPGADAGLIPYTHQRMRKERRALRRYHRGNPMDSPHNQKVRIALFFFFFFPFCQSITHAMSFHTLSRPPENLQVRLPRDKNPRDHRPVLRNRLRPR